MSHYMTALAMKQKGLKPATKIVLYWLADHFNGETGACFPSLSKLQDECEMNKTTIVRHLALLEAIGLIERVKRLRDNGSQTSTQYGLKMVAVPVAEYNSPCGKTQQAPVAKCPPLNLVSINLGSELEKAQKYACQIPDDWVPSEKNITDAQDKNFTDGEIKNEADKFRDYHLARGSKFKDWNAAWRTWLGNARKFGAARNTRAGSPHDSLFAAFQRNAMRHAE